MLKTSSTTKIDLLALILNSVVPSFIRTPFKTGRKRLTILGGNAIVIIGQLRIWFMWCIVG